MVLQNAGTYLVNVYSVVKDRRRKKFLLLIGTGRGQIITLKSKKFYLLSKSNINLIDSMAETILLCTATWLTPPISAIFSSGSPQKK